MRHCVVMGYGEFSSCQMVVYSLSSLCKPLDGRGLLPHDCEYQPQLWFVTNVHVRKSIPTYVIYFSDVDRLSIKCDLILTRSELRYQCKAV